MAFSAFTLAETAAKALMRQALWRKVKDDFDDHDLRLVRLDSGLRLSEHFNMKAPGALAEILPPLYELAQSASLTITYPAFSVLRLTTTAAGVLTGLIYRRPLNFGGVTPPIRLKARVKTVIDVSFHAGLKNAAGTSDVKGVWLERVDASNWRFVSYDTARNNGTNFTSVASGTWFEFEIVFTNSPSNQALCYLNGVLKETLVTQLPTTADLYGVVNFQMAGTTNWMEFDRWESLADGGLDAA